MELITQEEIFNSNFNSYKNMDLSFNSLLLYLKSNKYISDEDLKEIKSNFTLAITNYIYKIEEFDEYDDVENILQNYTNNIVKYIDHNLKSFENPYLACYYILNTDFTDIIKDSEKKYNNDRFILKENIKKLDDETISYRKKFMIFNITINTLINYSNTCYSGNESNTVLYHLMNDEKITFNEFDLKLYDAIYFTNKLLKENSIIKKFDKEDIKRVLSKLDIGDNIAKTLLCTYVFTSLYTDNPENLKISENTYNLIKREIDNNTIDLLDAKNSIENGIIEFSKEDLEYIKENFYPIFESKNKQTSLNLELKITK